MPQFTPDFFDGPAKVSGSFCRYRGNPEGALNMMVNHVKMVVCRCGTVNTLRKFGQPPARLLLEQRRVQVAAGAPFAVCDVLQAGGHQHQRGFPVGERADDAGAPPDLRERQNNRVGTRKLVVSRMLV